jgi:hypothetical protein
MDGFAHALLAAVPAAGGEVAVGRRVVAVTRRDRGLTSEVAFIITFLLGALATSEGVVEPAQRRWLITFGFGLVHGAGFATYLSSLFVDPIAVPLFGFNVGIELGQIVVLGMAAAGLTALDALIARIPLPAAAPGPLRLRVLAVSSVVALVATRWALLRSPW